MIDISQGCSGLVFHQILQTAKALHHLHDHAIVHGDVKAVRYCISCFAFLPVSYMTQSNILINDNHQASLADFGLSRILQETGFTTKTLLGTPRHLAPELVATGMDDEDDSILIPTGADIEGDSIPRVTAATDVWAFGMTILEVRIAVLLLLSVIQTQLGGGQIFTERMPFSHIRNDLRVVLAVLAGDRPRRPHCPQINDDMWEILQSCWEFDPSQRPSMASLLRFFVIQSTPRTILGHNTST